MYDKTIWNSILIDCCDMVGHGNSGGVFLSKMIFRQLTEWHVDKHKYNQGLWICRCIAFVNKESSKT